jgi:hypothetical protein
MSQGAISNRVQRVVRGEDPQVIARMPSGWAIYANQQPGPITGCCMLLPDPVVPAVNDLDPMARAAFMTDLVTLGRRRPGGHRGRADQLPDPVQPGP